MFADGMMLQRGKPVQIWGEAIEEGQHGAADFVTVSVAGQMTETSIVDGKWSVQLAPLEAGNGLVLTVDCGDSHVVISDVAVGEVWIAGGQSNMEFHMKYEKHFRETGQAPQNADIRFYDVPEVAYDGQMEAFDYSRIGVWRKAEPGSIEYFSAVGYYFANRLHEEECVPVGIIGCNWGGTASLAWMSAESVKEHGGLWWDSYLEKTKDLNVEEYYSKQSTNALNDRGNPLEDSFNNFMLPKTPSQEEIEAFFGTNMESSTIEPTMFPGCLYEHMVKVLAPYTVRGVLWYQGESDDSLEGGPQLYGQMLRALISDWRTLWQEELPFFVVQLTGFESWWMVECKDFMTIREMQEQVAKTDRNVYLCSIGDVGEQYDIHPKNKKTVGERLALLALGHAYGRNILCDAPVIRRVSSEGKNICLVFEHAGDGLHMDGNNLLALCVTDIKGKHVDYKVESIEGDTVRISFDGSMDGKLRISFARTNWFCVNLFNSAGIPAIPFEVTV